MKPTLEQELQETIEKVLQQGEQHFNAGQTQAAEDLFRAVLEIQPDNAEANHNLGVLLVQSEQTKTGLTFLRTAVATAPEYEHYWLSYIEALLLVEQLDAARQTLELGYGHGLKGPAAEELANRLESLQKSLEKSNQSTQRTRMDGPLDTSQQKPIASKLPHPKKTKAPSRQDIKKLAELRRKGRNSAIESFARELIAHYPVHGLGWNTLGSILDKQGRPEEALQALLKALEFLPDDSGVHNDLGVLFYKKGQLTEAESHLKKAVEIKPDFAAALGNLGNLYRVQGRLAESESVFRQAITLDPNPILYNNLATTLIDLDRIVEAETCYRRALSINPEFALGYTNLGVSLRKQGRLTEAIKAQRRAVKLNPQNTEQHSNLLFTLNYTTSTTNFFHLEEAQQYGRMVKRRVKDPFSSWLCVSQPDRLRVGFVSGDMYNHPVGFFLESMLGKIDSNRIELIAYPTNPKADDLTARLKTRFHAWRSLVGLEDEAAAKIIHDDGVHVLLDLSGHTSYNRLPMFVWKPAPVQASWLGYFATTGVTEMDFILVDEIGVPQSQKENFTETLWYLPDTRLCFSAPGFDIPVAPLPALTNNYITFGCFQMLTKVGDEVLKVWSDIFKALPDAHLRWQCRQFNDPAVVEDVANRLQSIGIDRERVTLHGLMPRSGYLAAHSEVDLLLDTFPYPGGTTTCEALWMGVPTITLAGDSLLSRQGASLLSAAGLNDWIAVDKKEYVSKTLSMASDLNTLADLRASLRPKALNSPLFDAQRFAANFEQALWGMWEQKQPASRFLASKSQDDRIVPTPGEDKPIMNFFSPVFWGTKDPEHFKDLMKKAADQTAAYHFGDNMFLFQRNNSMLNDQPFMQSWKDNIITPPDGTIIWRRYILAMAGFHCMHLEGDFVECGAYQGTGAKTVVDYLGGKDFSKTFWLYDLFEHNEKMANHPMQGHSPELYGQVVKRFADYQNVKIFKGLLPEVLEQGSPEKIAYLHLDLNQAPAEIATLEALFDRVVPGGMIILDDYEMAFYRPQKLAEDVWFGSRGYKVFPLPTSQGFVIKR